MAQSLVILSLWSYNCDKIESRYPQTDFFLKKGCQQAGTLNYYVVRSVVIRADSIWINKTT